MVYDLVLEKKKKKEIYVLFGGFCLGRDMI